MNDIKKEDIKNFLEQQNTVVNTFRTLLLFGRNSATYKFAFCHALLKLKPSNSIGYSDLRDEFIKELLRHHQVNPNQFNAGENTVSKAMDAYLHSEQSSTDWEALILIAEKNIYNNVFDAFQNVGSGTINHQYQLFEHDKKNKIITLTDNTNFILESPDLVKTIDLENQSRWNIVEEAWRSKLSPNMLEYNKQNNSFSSLNTQFERVNLRSAVDVLSPYQKGKCFYCNRPLNSFTDTQDDDFPEVDHFLPFSMMVNSPDIKINPNGVWNLVIACKSCNRGADGKFDAPPHQLYFNKLLNRNLLFSEEHKHSLRNSIFLSLNAKSKAEIKDNMFEIYQLFKIFNGWKPKFLY